MSAKLQQLRRRLRKTADPSIIPRLERYFRAVPGGYGEGDRFLGIRVPVLRRLVKEYRALSLDDITVLLRSPWHEERQFALLSLVDRFRRGDKYLRKSIYRIYSDNTARINNWDLVDSSAPDIVGGYLWKRDKEPIFRLARSPRVWDRRIAVLATLYLIRRNEFATLLELAEMLLDDPEDLIQKAVGWMLREVGKRDREPEEKFLEKNCRKMPPVMLRYALEKFSREERTKYRDCR